MRILVRPPAIPDDSSAPAPSPRPGWESGASVWLVRHGDVEDEWQARAYGNLDVPLSGEGHAQTRALCSAFAGLPLARVSSSPLSRALALGRGLAQATGATLVVDER